MYVGGFFLAWIFVVGGGGGGGVGYVCLWKVESGIWAEG